MVTDSWDRAGRWLLFHGVRAVERGMPLRLLQVLTWLVGARMATWELMWGQPSLRLFDRLPRSLRPAATSPGWTWRLWWQRTRLNQARILSFWPDRLHAARWRPRCQYT